MGKLRNWNLIHKKVLFCNTDCSTGQYTSIDYWDITGNDFNQLENAGNTAMPGLNVVPKSRFNVQAIVNFVKLGYKTSQFMQK